MINPGDIVQTKKYASSNRGGVKIFVREVQEALIPGLVKITGVQVKKNGEKGKRIITVEQGEL